MEVYNKNNFKKKMNTKIKEKLNLKNFLMSRKNTLRIFFVVIFCLTFGLVSHNVMAQASSTEMSVKFEASVTDDNKFPGNYVDNIIGALYIVENAKSCTYSIVNPSGKEETNKLSLSDIMYGTEGLVTTLAKEAGIYKFSLVCVDASDEFITKKLDIEVEKMPLPQITIFYTSQTVRPGEKITLVWDTLYAKNCLLDGNKVATSTGSTTLIAGSQGTDTHILKCTGYGLDSSGVKTSVEQTAQTWVRPTTDIHIWLDGTWAFGDLPPWVEKLEYISNNGIDFYHSGTSLKIAGVNYPNGASSLEGQMYGLKYDWTVTKNLNFLDINNLVTNYDFDVCTYLQRKKLGKIPLEVCGNGIDDDGNGKTDCDDPYCIKNDYSCYEEWYNKTYLPRLETKQPNGYFGENCVSGDDKNGNGAIGCADPDCARYDYSGETGPGYGEEYLKSCPSSVQRYTFYKDPVTGQYTHPPYFAEYICEKEPHNFPLFVPVETTGNSTLNTPNMGEFWPILGSVWRVIKAKSGGEPSVFMPKAGTVESNGNKEGCNSKVDENGDDYIDCNDPQCTNSIYCKGSWLTPPFYSQKDYSLIPTITIEQADQNEKLDCFPYGDNEIGIKWDIKGLSGVSYCEATTSNMDNVEVTGWDIGGKLDNKSTNDGSGEIGDTTYINVKTIDEKGSDNIPSIEIVCHYDSNKNGITNDPDDKVVMKAVSFDAKSCGVDLGFQVDGQPSDASGCPDGTNEMIHSLKDETGTATWLISGADENTRCTPSGSWNGTGGTVDSSQNNIKIKKGESIGLSCKFDNNTTIPKDASPLVCANVMDCCDHRDPKTPEGAECIKIFGQDQIDLSCKTCDCNSTTTPPILGSACEISCRPPEITSFTADPTLVYAGIDEADEYYNEDYVDLDGNGIINLCDMDHNNDGVPDKGCVLQRDRSATTTLTWSSKNTKSCKVEIKSMDPIYSDVSTTGELQGSSTKPNDSFDFPADATGKYTFKLTCKSEKGTEVSSTTTAELWIKPNIKLDYEDLGDGKLKFKIDVKNANLCIDNYDNWFQFPSLEGEMLALDNLFTDTIDDITQTDLNGKSGFYQIWCGNDGSASLAWDKFMEKCAIGTVYSGYGDKDECIADCSYDRNTSYDDYTKSCVNECIPPLVSTAIRVGEKGEKYMNMCLPCPNEDPEYWDDGIGGLCHKCAEGKTYDSRTTNCI